MIYDIKFITGVLHNRKENFGYGTCSKCFAYSIESQGLRYTRR